MPARNSFIDPEFCAASRERRRLAGVRAGPPAGGRASLLGPGIRDFSACFYDVDLSTLSSAQLYLYHHELTGRLRIIAAELGRRIEACVHVSLFWSCFVCLVCPVVRVGFDVTAPCIDVLHGFVHVSVFVTYCLLCGLVVTML